MRRRGIGICALLFCSATGGSAVADEAKAEQLFRDGKALLKQGQVAEACAAFAASHRASAAVSTLLNLADCYQQQGKLATAWETFLAAERAAAKEGAAGYRRVATEKAAALEARMPMVTFVVDTPVPGMSLNVDGTVLERGAWGRPLPIDAGTHEVSASAPEHQPWSTSIVVEPGSRAQSVRVPALARATVSRSAFKSPDLRDRIYAGGGGFATNGAYGGEVGASYGISSIWDVHGSILLGRSSTTLSSGGGASGTTRTYPIDLTLIRVRATRHFPRSSRLRPFVGFAALIDNARVEGGVGTTIGVSVEPGLYLDLSDNLRLFVELPIGVVKPIDISWSDEAGATLTTPIDPFFGGLAAGLHFGGRI